MDTGEPDEYLDSAIRQLLAERQQLLVMFCRAAGIARDPAGEDEKSVLLRLCQLLMDYAALWQFEIHDELVREDRCSSVGSAMLEREQPMLVEAANIMLDFNDLVDSALAEGRLMDLDSRLSALGEALAERFEAEDRVILAL
jgi:regulator of sigma D